MSDILRKASSSDIPTLVDMMADYYVEEAIAFDEAEAQNALGGLIEDARNGGVWMVCHADAIAGYVALTLGYSLEFGGRDAFIDDIYVKKSFRDQGLGSHALNEIIDTAASLGVRAIHLEVDPTNKRARHIYSKAGFTGRERYFLMSRHLV